MLDATTPQRLDPGDGPRFAARTRPPAPWDPESAAPDGESPQAQLLRLASNCPRCGSRPALRITGEVAKLLADEAQGARLGTYQCQRRGCGAIYDLVAGEFLAEE